MSAGFEDVAENPDLMEGGYDDYGEQEDYGEEGEGGEGLGGVNPFEAIA